MRRLGVAAWILSRSLRGRPSSRLPASLPRRRRLSIQVTELHPTLSRRTAPTVPNSPSIHYRQDVEHAGRPYAFEPGGRVDVPFRPRAGDAWLVDGKQPRALPPGHATGRQMRDGADGICLGRRPTFRRGHARGRRRGRRRSGSRRRGSRPDVPTAVVPALSAVLASTTIDAATSPLAIAPIGPSGLRREVFGFLPYWEVSDSSTVLDWRVLSTVAYFSVGCTSGGNLAKKNSDGSTTTGWAGWTSSKMTSIITAAHQNQTRVVLTVRASPGAAAARRRRPTARQRDGALDPGEADRRRRPRSRRRRCQPRLRADRRGLRRRFTALVRSIRSRAEPGRQGYQLTFDTPSAPSATSRSPKATAPGGAGRRSSSWATTTGSKARRRRRLDLAARGSPIRPHGTRSRPTRPRSRRRSTSFGVPFYGRAWSTTRRCAERERTSRARSTAARPHPPVRGWPSTYAAQYGRRYDSDRAGALDRVSTSRHCTSHVRLRHLVA